MENEQTKNQEVKGPRFRKRPPLPQAGATQPIWQLARQHSEAMFKVLLDLAHNAESEAVRKDAAQSVLDRAFGKPAQSVAIADLGSERPAELSAQDTTALDHYARKLADRQRTQAAMEGIAAE